MKIVATIVATCIFVPQTTLIMAQGKVFVHFRTLIINLQLVHATPSVITVLK